MAEQIDPNTVPESLASQETVQELLRIRAEREAKKATDQADLVAPVAEAAESGKVVYKSGETPQPSEIKTPEDNEHSAAA